MTLGDSELDEKLTLLAFRRCGIANDVVVERDGATALDYRYATEYSSLDRAGEGAFDELNRELANLAAELALFIEEPATSRRP